MNDTLLLILIASNVIFTFKGLNDESFFRKYEFHMGSYLSGEKIRMLTSAFLHVDIFHLAFNMIALYSFAPVVLNNFGHFIFILIYFGSLIIGNLLTIYFHKNEFQYRAVGASGAVTGIIYSSIIVYPNMMIGIFGVIPLPAYVFGIGYLLYSIYGMKSRQDNIGHTAHFGGAIGGYVITLACNPLLISQNTMMVVLLAIPIVILFIMSKSGKL